MMQVSKKVPFDDPNTLNMVRAMYIVSNILIAGIYYYVKMQIDKKKGMWNNFQSTMAPRLRCSFRNSANNATQTSAP